jgi:protein-disulfide isomerase
MSKAIAALFLSVLFVAGAQAEPVPWGKLPNFDSSDLSESVRSRAVALMKTQSCYYECSKTVFECVTQTKPARTALRLAGFITRQVVRGKSDSEIGKMIMDRARSAHPFKKAAVSVDDAPCTGSATAKVIVTAFSDFDCPFCKLISPQLVKLSGALGKEVTYCFKLFPVKGHGALAVETSKAGYAAFKLGQFWKFHDIMYAHFEDHDDADVKGYVADCGLSWSEFQSLKDASGTRKAIVASKREGLKLGVKSTPAIFVNGKRYYGEKTEVELKDRLEEELDLVK